MSPNSNSADGRARSSTSTVVVVLSSRWRVVECPDAIQWIAQKRAGYRHGRERWDNCRYFRTRKALLAFVRALPVEIEPDALAMVENLPEWIGGRP